MAGFVFSVVATFVAGGNKRPRGLHKLGEGA